MRLWNPKARRVKVSRSGRLSARKLSARNIVVARLGLALAGSVLIQSVALADNAGAQDGKGAAWQEFRQSNPGLRGSELNQLFKVHWSNANPNAVRSVAQPFFENNSVTQTQTSIDTNANLSNLTRHETRAAEHALKFQQSAAERAQKIELKAGQNALRQESHEAMRNFNNTVQQVATNRFVNINGGLSLDLGSAVETITLGDKLFQQGGSVTITVGGESKTLGAGAKVTAAEYVAAKQMIETGGQKLNIDGNGRAIGGEVDLSALTSGNRTLRVKDLEIPVAVTASGDFGKGGDVRISGDLINSGNVVAYSSEKSVNTAGIFADNITNNETGNFTSQLNEVSQSHGGVVGDLNLSLNAEDSLSNYGTIISAGDLTLSGGRSLTNESAISAQNNLNVLAPKIINTGTLASIAGDVNLGTPVDATLTVNSTGGSIQSLGGAINLRSTDYASRFDTTVIGGDLLSKELNVNAGGGTVNIAVNDLTGTVNSIGNAIHVSADTNTLLLGTQCLTGDPTYFNTGDISINGAVTPSESLAIIAGGNIMSAGGSFSITADDGESNGADILLVAGVNVSGTGSQFPLAASSASFSGPTVNGGNIDLSNVIGLVHASAIGTNGNAGDITIAAYKGTSGTNGTINLGSTLGIRASGNGNGANGSVSIYAGSDAPTAITVGSIENHQGSGAAPITIVSAQPTFSSGSSMTFGPNGNITSGNTITSSSTFGTGSLTGGTITTNGQLLVQSSGAIALGSISATNGGSARVISAGTLNLGGVDVSSNVLNVAAGDIVLQANLMTVGNLNASHTLTDGNAGSVLINSATTADIGSITASASGVGNGGSIEFNVNSNIPFRVGTSTVSSNEVGNLNVDAGSIGSGGSLSFKNAGGGVFFTGTTPSFAVTEGDGGHFTVETKIGQLLFLDSLSAGIDVSAKGIGNHDGGSISLTFGGASIPANLPLLADATGTGNGGTIYLNFHFPSGGSIDTSDFTFSALGTGGLIDLRSSFIFVESALNAENVSLLGGSIGIGVELKPKYLDITTNSLGLLDGLLGASDFSTESISIVCATMNSHSNTNYIRAKTVSISNSSGLAINSNSGAFNIASTNGTFVSAGNGSMNLTGAINFLGTTYLVAAASGQSITAQSGSAITTNAVSYALSSNITNAGNFTNVPPNGLWVFGNVPPGTNGTFAHNSTLVLSGNLSFGGSNIAVISNGDIDLTGATISLDGVSGGNLTMLAGYDFLPSTPNQAFNTGTFSGFTANGTGGSIIGDADLSTRGTSGSGGRVVLAANGSVNVGSITTTGTSAGGSVTVIGKEGVTVGAVTTTGGTTDGSVTLAVAVPVVSANLQIQAGAVTQGTIDLGATPVLGSGDLIAGAIMAGGATVTVYGASNFTTIVDQDTIDLTAGVSAAALNLNLNNGTVEGITAVSNLSVNCAGTGTVNVENTGALTVTTSGSNAHLIATTTGALTAGAALTVGTLDLSGLSIDLTNGATANNGAFLVSTGGDIVGSISTGSGALVLNATGDIGVDSSSRFATNATNLTVDATGDAFLKATSTTGVAFNSGTVGGTFDLDADSDVSTAASNTITAGSVVLTLGAGVDAGTVFNKFGITNGVTAMSLTLNLSSTSDAFIGYEGTAALTFTATNAEHLNVHALNNLGSLIIGATGVTADQDITLTTTTLTNANTVTSTNGDINITSNATGGLTLNGNLGPLPATGTFQAGAGDEINVRALTGNLVLEGITTYNSTANLTANLAGQSVITNVGSNSIATVNSFIFTPALTNNGALTTLTPPGQTWFVVNSGTYANGSGDLTLSGAFNFSSGNLAFIASSNINMGSATIDLSGATGGNLTVMSGFNFSPNSPIFTHTTTQTFDNFNNGGAGNITMGTVNLSGTSGAGGNLIALANNGSITMNTINTSGTAGGGNVTLYASNGITTGAITATGGTGVGGTVDIRAANPTVSADFSILNGSISNGTINVPVGFTAGPISVGAVNTGNGNFLAQTDGILTLSGALSAHDITLVGPTLNLNALSALTSTVDAGGNAGTIFIATDSIQTATNNHLQVVAQGTGAGNGGEIIVNWGGAAVTLGSNNLIAGFGFQTGAVSGAGGSTEFNSNSNVTINAGAFTGNASISGSEVGVTSNGDINVTANSAFNLAGIAGTGAKIELVAGDDGTGTLNLGGNTAWFTGATSQANATGAEGSGGGIVLSGSNITFTGVGDSAANALALSAHGVGGGDGGTIIFRTKNTAGIFVGQPAKAPKAPFLFLQANASAGGVGSNYGGTLEITTGGNLTISDVSLVDAASGPGARNGASFTFKAGAAATGALLINGNLFAPSVGIIGGVITLSSNTKNTFGINPSKTPQNGIVGNLFTGDGEINVTNLGGGILVRGGIEARRMHFTVGTAKGSFTTENGAIIQAEDEITFQASGGSIGGKAPVNVITSVLQANTNGKGVVQLQNLNTGVMTLLDSTSGGNFSLLTNRSATLNDITTTGKGSISIRNGTGNLSVANNATITANNGSLTLQNANAGGQILIGDGATVETQGKGGNVVLAVEANLQTTGTNPTTTSVGGITVNVQGKGVVFLGGPPSAVVATTTATVNAINKNVLFFGGAGSIVLGTGSTVTADPPSPTPSVAAVASLRGGALHAPANLAAPSNSGLFGFLTENATVTSDLSVLNINVAPQAQVANNATLITAGSIGLAGVDGKSTFAANADDDNSYAVGYMGLGGETDAAICSDVEIVSGHVAAATRVKNIQHSERVVIKKGNVLFVPFKDTTVETPNGIVHISAKSIALVSSNENGLAVYDLEDQHKGSVIVESNGHNVILSPGRHVMITPHHGAEFAQINAVETIAHRNVASTLKNGHRAHTSEFSVITALESVKPLKALAMSKHWQAKQIANRMLKTTAIILQIGGAGEQYQHYFKPRMTAMRK